VKLIGTEELLRLTKQASIDFNPAWSPDGHYIAFCRIRKGETGIYIIPAIGGAERRVREAHWEEQDFDDVLALRMAACVNAGERSMASGPGSSGESPADARSTDSGVPVCPSGALGWTT
jgi:hypothetical protein